MPSATIVRKPSGVEFALRPNGEDTLRTSTDHILTSHAGSLPRPDALIAANRAHETGDAIDERAFDETLRACRGRGRAPSERARRRHPGRRRIRQADGPARQLRLVVALFVAAPWRARSRARTSTR